MLIIRMHANVESLHLKLLMRSLLRLPTKDELEPG